jgi:hypothetical protein
MNAMDLGNPVTLILIIVCAIGGAFALSRLETYLGGSRWIDRTAGFLGLVIFTALVLLAGVYAGVDQ